MSEYSIPEEQLMALLEKKDEILWLQEAAKTMRVKLDKQPDDLGPQSDKTALRILAVLENQRAAIAQAKEQANG